MKNVFIRAGFLIIDKTAMIRFKNIDSIKVVDDTITEIPLTQVVNNTRIQADVEKPKEEIVLGISIEHKDGIDFFETKTLEEAEGIFQNIQEALFSESHKS